MLASHLMFFVPRTTPNSWGANLPGSPIVSGDDPEDRITIFLVPVGHWSDGTVLRRSWTKVQMANLISHNTERSQRSQRQKK
jgi:hypothetical protein